MGRRGFRSFWHFKSSYGTAETMRVTGGKLRI
jgi:hypothetical protein